MSSKKKSRVMEVDMTIGTNGLEKPVAMIIGDAEPVVEPRTADVDATEKGLVTFAFRLTPAERDEIHAAAGPGKASRFVKGVALAVARTDGKAIQEVVDAVALRLTAAHSS
jgi:hypothetical protein